MHVISLTTIYRTDDNTLWFATDESNLSHSDNKWNNLLFPITYNEQYQIDHSYEYGEGRFKHYRDWQFEYHQSTHCCQINHSVKRSPRFDGEIAGVPIAEIVKAIPPDIVPHGEPNIDYELEEIVNWLGKNATDVWSIELGTYGSERSFFLKNKSDYEKFVDTFKATIDNRLQHNNEITDIVEKLLQERRDRLKSEGRIWERLHRLENKIKTLK